MESTIWREELLTSIPVIDRQHIEIARRTEDLLLALRSDTPDAQISKLLSGLIDVTANHFSTEKRLMLASGYSGFEQHRIEHRRLLEQLQAVYQSLAIGRAMVHEGTVTFLKTLTEQHIFF